VDDAHRAADTADQRQLVAGGEAVAVIGVLLVDCHHHRDVADQVLHLGQRVGHARVVGQLSARRSVPARSRSPANRRIVTFMGSRLRLC